MKKNILFLTLGILIGCLIMPLAINADSPIRLVVNGNNISCDQPPVIMNGRILVPVRAVSDALGCEISWDQPTRTVTVSQKNIVSSPVKTDPVQLEKDNPKPSNNTQTSTVNNKTTVQKTTYNGMEAIIKNGITYVRLHDYINKIQEGELNSPNVCTFNQQTKLTTIYYNGEKIEIPFVDENAQIIEDGFYINSKYCK